MNLSAKDRLDASHFMLGEMYFRATQAEQRAAQQDATIKELQAEVAELKKPKPKPKPKPKRAARK